MPRNNKQKQSRMPAPFPPAVFFSEEESGVGRELNRKLKKIGISPTNANVRKVIEESKTGNILIPTQLDAAIAKAFPEQAK